MMASTPGRERKFLVSLGQEKSSSVKSSGHLTLTPPSGTQPAFKYMNRQWATEVTGNGTWRAGRTKCAQLLSKKIRKEKKKRGRRKKRKPKKIANRLWCYMPLLSFREWTALKENNKNTPNLWESEKNDAWQTQGPGKTEKCMGRSPMG